MFTSFDIRVNSKLYLQHLFTEGASLIQFSLSNFASSPKLQVTIKIFLDTGILKSGSHFIVIAASNSSPSIPIYMALKKFTFLFAPNVDKQFKTVALF